jgi:hypothetical protein
MEGQANEQPVEERIAAYFAKERGEAPKEVPVKAEEPEEVVAEEGDTSEAEVAEEQPETESEAPEEVVKYRFKVKNESGQDEEVEMTPEEMQKSVMLEKDYRRKTTDLAKQRQTLEKESEAKLEAERRQYVENLDLVQKALTRAIAPEFQGVDMNKLAEEDPAKYVQLSNRMTQVGQLMQAIQQEQARANAENQQKSEKETAAKVQEAREVLHRDIPGWNDTLYQDLLRTGVEAYGLSMDEVGNVIDPRSIKILHDAYQYRKMKEGKPVVEKKVSLAPKVLKPQQPRNAKQDDATALRKQLKSSGDVATFAELLKRKGY